MVVFEGQTGNVGGHYGTCVYASDTGARFRFGEYGEVDFNVSGYGENAKVSVQLQKEYNRYFCYVGTCNGFKSWISSLATVTAKPTACRVTMIVFDSVTKTAVEGAKVCVGLMCQNTPGNGEVYVGQFALGTYTLKITKAGYQDYTEQITLSTAELRTARSIAPSGDVPSTLDCAQWPAFFQPVCVVVRDFVYAPLLAAINTASALITSTKSELSSLITSSIATVNTAISSVRTDLTAYINQSVSSLSATLNSAIMSIEGMFSDVWASIQQIDDILIELDKKIDDAAAMTFSKIEAWLVERILEIILTAIDRTWIYGRNR